MIWRWLSLSTLLFEYGPEKSQNVCHRKGRENYTSAKSANQEGLQATPALDHSSEKITELSLPASPQALRPGTPQDFTSSSSNCQGLQRLANDFKGYSISIDGCHRGINALIQAGLTDPNNSIMLNNTKVLEEYNQIYQQAQNNHFLDYEDRQGTRLLPVASEWTGSAINHRRPSSYSSELNDNYVSRYPEDLDLQQRTFYSTVTTTRNPIHSIWDGGFLVNPVPNDPSFSCLNVLNR
ncbi:hypothetical protein TNCV_2449871 [Trichonephila clavipes]|uniref:Uncharacterized protein n=1 Tax=Trichonephila clavipes TaxID=2585209 RepID=A0A8X6UZZ4_TRICX|nr:hypothetical protein TNCV_2449871 [Trichonephila clavipes]